MENKIIAGAVALGIVGMSIVGATGACVDANGVTMFAAEEVIIRDVASSLGKQEVKDVGKMCFKTQKDYDKFKDDNINAYKVKTEDERGWWILHEGKVLDDILTHEIQKKGLLSFPHKAGDDVILDIINNL